MPSRGFAKSRHLMPSRGFAKSNDWKSQIAGENQRNLHCQHTLMMCLYFKNTYFYLRSYYIYWYEITFFFYITNNPQKYIYIYMRVSWKVHRLKILQVDDCWWVFYQWDTSTSTLIEEVCGSQERLCWKINIH